MFQSAKVAVVVPCFREARLIQRTLAGMPAFVDLIVVVDDAGDDGTAEVVRGVTDIVVNCWFTPTIAGSEPRSSAAIALPWPLIATSWW